MQLYYIPTTRAVRPRWVLEEMGLSYELITVDIETTRQRDYQKLHPHGKVPVLVDEGVVIYESSAICSYLSDRYIDQGLAPALDSSARAYYYQWLFYASVTLEPPVEQYLFQKIPNLPENILPEGKRKGTSEQETLQWFQQVCEPLNDLLANNDYLVQNQFTTADIVTGGVLHWAFKLDMLQKETPIYRYLINLIERPAFKRANDQQAKH